MNGTTNLTGAMKTIADNIGKYILENYVKPYTKSTVRFYRAEVATAASGGKIGVKRPFDTTVQNLPYVTSAAGLAVGDQCVVFMLGSPVNSFVIGDGKLSNL